MKRRIGRILQSVLIIILLLVGVSLIFHSQIENFWIVHQNNTKISKINKKEIAQGNNKKGKFDFSAVQAINNKNVMGDASNASKLPSVGMISIPDLKIKMPIFKGVTTTNLTIGAGTMKPDQKMGEGNYALAGHHMKDPETLFSPLSKAKNKQLIYLTNLDKVYVYKVNEVKIVPQTEINVIENHPNKKQVTLVTCASGNPGEPNRIIVTGNLIKVSPLTKEDQKQYFS